MDETSARLTAQAKINLFLVVGDLLPSGFHEIQTLFQRIELGDDVVVRASSSSQRSIECHRIDVGPPEKNIAFKAAALYSETCGWPRGFSISIDKVIQPGSGMGGGSGDAAAVLRILNHLSPRPVASYDLLDIAAKVGSDVAFLVSDSCLSLADGRGERLTPVRPLPVRGVTLFQMPFRVATADAYRWIDEIRAMRSIPGPRPKRITPSDVITWDDVARVAHNDFEEVVCERHENLAVLLASARSADYEMAEMTGSGSTVFALSDGPEPVRAPNHVAPGVRQLLTRTAASPSEIESEF